MAKVGGFKELPRETPPYRPIEERLLDWREVATMFSEDGVRTQAGRCMECGVPFCHWGCPLGNIVPDWNDLIHRGRWREALDLLHSTNNFPEFTGRICPALCEESCVLNIGHSPVTIRQIELSIIEHGFAEGWVTPEPPARSTGRRVAVVGSGPAGLACAQQLARVGHAVTVFERDERIGGLLVHGIPDFKMEKHVVQRRLDQMAAEGVLFRPSVHVGVDFPLEDLRREFDAICLTGGSRHARDLPIPGRDLDGIHFALDFLEQQNRRNAGTPIAGPEILATGKRVVILGGGDTGSDCLGTSLRQGPRQVMQFELLPEPPVQRTVSMPWPHWPMILRTSSSHEEGGIRDWSITTKAFSGENGRVTTLHCMRLEWSEPDEHGRPKMREIPGSEFTVDADLVLLALGYLHPEHGGMLSQLGVEFDARGNVKTDESYRTSIPGVFSAGDMRRGQSLIVWAILEGREAAHHIDAHLMGHSDLPLCTRGAGQALPGRA
jgi:glutamate synthase (NADPH/NADH) small chain